MTTPTQTANPTPGLPIIPLSIPDDLHLPYPSTELAQEIEKLYLGRTPDPIQISEILGTSIHFVLAVILQPTTQRTRALLDAELFNSNTRSLLNTMSDISRASVALANKKDATQEDRRRVGTLNASLTALLKGHNFLKHGTLSAAKPATLTNTNTHTATLSNNTAHTNPTPAPTPKPTITREQLLADPRWHTLYARLSPQAQLYTNSLTPNELHDLLPFSPNSAASALEQVAQDAAQRAAPKPTTQSTTHATTHAA
jgi:hypothetical protein